MPIVRRNNSVFSFFQMLACRKILAGPSKGHVIRALIARTDPHDIVKCQVSPLDAMLGCAHLPTLREIFIVGLGDELSVRCHPTWRGMGQCIGQDFYDNCLVIGLVCQK
jgi:hypothetical protein